MILLRDKNFTRAEKEMLKQAYRVTGGFRRLPGKGITSVEDAEALARLNNDFTRRYLSLSPGTVTITPEARAALDRLGLTKVDEKTLNRMLVKYHGLNGDAIERVNNIRKIRLSNNQPLLDRTMKKLKRRNDEAYNYRDKVVKELGSNHLYLSETKEESSEPIARFMRKKLGVLPYRYPNNKVGGKYIFNASKLTEEEINKLLQSQLDEKRSNAQNINNLIRSCRNSGPMLVVNPSSKQVIALHEWGHRMNRKKGLGNTKLEFDPKNPRVSRHFISSLNNIGQIAEENMASARALEVLRNQGQKEQDLGRIGLNKALETYLGTSKAEGTYYMGKYPYV